MKFKFSLEKLLTYRKSEEDMARKDFLAAQFALNVENEKLSQMYADIDRTRDYIHGLENQGGRQAEGLVQSFQFIKGTELRIENQKEMVRKQQLIVEEKQEILRQAAIEYKMIERLKDKRHEAFKETQKKAEQKFVDEMTMARFKGVKI